MKNALAIILALALCFGITACAGTSSEETVSTEAETIAYVPTPPPTEETKPITYTYKADPMQNASCVYYGPHAYVPNCPDPSQMQGKVVVWTQCPNCGEDHIGCYTVDPEELDFSFGDTIIHSDTDSCWDCSWDKGIDRFMWTIRITRIPE